MELGPEGRRGSALGSLVIKITGPSLIRVMRSISMLLKLYFMELAGGSVAKTHAPNVGSLGSIPVQGTRCHMAQLKIPCCNKDPRSRELH